ncbi:pirin family protein [Psychromonas sp. MB-3u-54]|uniref:pirin family protein n=1 Tax=Psychromonas sp. MB-3u-54 TaxID=2058319 RepID=UPI000C34C899|nr:pirin-like bicupin family protein [Psychromonas sp. MB-3u-54]PKH03322.1 pirin family protein [Psychromonas sp. MB-3u-54]
MTASHQKISASELYYLPSSAMHPANTRFHFSFANYYDPTRMSFGALRVLNDDDVTPHSGFGRHPHRDMEIVSYIVKGKLTHWDSVTKSDETIGRGHVQAISAGSGIWHSELNKQDDWCRFLQIWIMPPKTGGPVRYNHQQFELKDRENKLLHIVGNPKNKDSSPLYINSDVNLYVSELSDSRAIVEFELKPDRQAYTHDTSRCKVSKENCAEMLGIKLKVSYST